MFEKVEGIVQRYRDISDKLSAGTINTKEMIKLNKESTQLEPIVDVYTRFKEVKEQLSDNSGLLQDEDLEIRQLAKEEIFDLEKEVDKLTKQLRILLLPKDPNDEKNVILEIRAGTGGDEASLFAGQLFQMYARFAEGQGWKAEILSSSEGAKGGFKEIVITVSGKSIYSYLKYESGVHRVQRVPETESQGRIHTSACSVVVLPEAEEIDVKIENKDIRIDVFRAGGPGGQSVNTTDSAVRITHIPSGLVVQCQDEKSQLKNKNKAMRVLRSRLYDQIQEKQNQERSSERKAMVKTGDRSDKIRTYNFPQDRCTDHRANITVHNLPKLFSGEISDLVTSISNYFQVQALKKNG